MRGLEGENNSGIQWHVPSTRSQKKVALVSNGCQMDVKTDANINALGDMGGAGWRIYSGEASEGFWCTSLFKTRLQNSCIEPVAPYNFVSWPFSVAPLECSRHMRMILPQPIWYASGNSTMGCSTSAAAAGKDLQQESSSKEPAVAKATEHIVDAGTPAT